MAFLSDRHRAGLQQRRVALERGRIERIIESDFRANLDGRREPVLPADAIVEIGGLDARALAVDVVEIFRAPGDVVEGREFVVEISDARPFPRRAARLNVTRTLRGVR